ncbi:MAG: hypothetical protein ACPLRN_00430 [Microgenomates group bacterium]
MKKFASVIIIFLFFFLSQPVLAQQVSLSISPPLLEAVIKPGKSVMIAYKVENFGDPVYLKAKVVSFEPKDNLGKINLKNELNGPVRFSLDNADLELEQPFFLKTGQSQQILLKIRVPDGAPEGDYYYTLLAETTPLNPQPGIASTQAKAAIGSNILITVSSSGLVEVKPKVVLFQTSKKIYDSFEKIPLIFIIANKGKNLIKPEGKITLTGSFGEKMSFDIIPKNILSESERLVEASPSASFEDPSAKNPVSLILPGFFVGWYRLSTAVSFGENSPTVYASTSFFAFPFKLTAIIIILITIIIYLIKRYSNNEE